MGKTNFWNRSWRKNLSGYGVVDNDRGVVLVTAIILLLMLVVFAAVSTRWSSMDIKRTARYTKTRSSFYLAEAGLQRAINYFNYDSSGNSPGEVNNGFDDEIDGTNWPAGTFSNITLVAGTYTVTVSDNNDNDGDLTDDVDNSVVLTSTGTKDGISVSLEAVVYRPLYKGQYAIISEGDVTVSGSSTSISGSNGSVHTNADFSQSGGPSIALGANASGSCSGSECNSAGGEPKEAIPTVEPTDYEQFADYIFNGDGTIDRRLSDGTLQTGVEGEALFSKFSHNAQGWSVGNNANIGTEVPNQAFLYFKDDVKAASIGSSSTPWEITIVTEGDISWTGNAYITNWKDSAHEEGVQNLFLIANTDIKVSSMDQDTQGLIAAKDQVDIAGGATIEGYILAKDLTTTDNLVQGEAVKVHGGITITYNGDLVAPFLSDKVSILSWQEM